ncbi:MAG: hypothetical protein PHF07_01690 [Candidatus Pacebacteria bacterium]|jgi:hypothetical protein|nr:hypothetical protein [Candidatus Paceibacterota bacterium]
MLKPILGILAVIILGFITWGAYQLFPAHQENAAEEELAKTSASSFMAERINRNQEAALEWTTQQGGGQYLLRSDLPLIGLSNPHLSDFEILDTERLAEDKFQIKVRIYEEYAGLGRTGYFNETLELVKSGERYLVDSFERGGYTNLYTEEISRGIARIWIEEESPTYTFDGMNLEFQEALALDLADCHNCYQFVYEFESRHAGYGDRTGQVLAQVITPHTIIVTVENGRVTGAVIDEVYDDMAQKMLSE